MFYCLDSRECGTYGPIPILHKVPEHVKGYLTLLTDITVTHGHVSSIYTFKNIKSLFRLRSYEVLVPYWIECYAVYYENKKRLFWLSRVELERQETALFCITPQKGIHSFLIHYHASHPKFEVYLRKISKV